MEMVLHHRHHHHHQQRAGSTGVAAPAPACRPAGQRPGTTAAAAAQEEKEAAEELRRGPWTVEEDLTLVNYIADHGEGRWNALARAAGLKRTGKSCRLRWLNYLRPDVKRGDFTADEQLLILDLHSRWGNRWSKIAQHLPGRTDNEIKNYWRTRVQKHAKQLNCDVNSQRFKDAMAFLWMPRLAERASQAAAAAPVSGDLVSAPATATTASPETNYYNNCSPSSAVTSAAASAASSSSTATTSSSFTSPESTTTATHEEKSAHPHLHGGDEQWAAMQGADHEFWSAAAPAMAMAMPPLMSLDGGGDQFQDLQELTGWVQGFSEGVPENLWSLEDIWRMQ
ncbi:hypothetical protein ACP4OV_001969 [Aristida adscensionis]